MQRHPKYLNGDCTEEELYLKFLNNFETDGVSKQVSALSADDIFQHGKDDIWAEIVKDYK